MEFFYGLALILTIFDGFIIQCEGGNLFGIVKDPIDEVSENQSYLPAHLIEEILFISGFETTRKAAQAQIRCGEAMKNIFKDRTIIIDIRPHEKHEEIIEYVKNGVHYLKIRNYRILMSLFQLYGENARRIHIFYDKRNGYMNEDMRRDINKNIINKYAKYLIQLEFYAYSYSEPSERIWEEISNENGQIHFPEVKKFECRIDITKNVSLDLNSIFPKLEILLLSCEIVDLNCLAKVEQLKELSLITETEEKQFVNIIANNKQLTKLTICGHHTFKTLQSIEENLKNLKTLNLLNVDEDFFIPTTNKTYNLTSVTDLIMYDGYVPTYKNLSFDMPNLKKLELTSLFLNDRIAKFINRFHKLETAYVDELHEDCAMNCIESLTYVKEFGTVNFENSELSSLKVFFENFDETKSNLNTLKLFDFDISYYHFYEDTMKEINYYLNESMKPTWKISYGYGKLSKMTKNYLEFKRDL